MVSVVDIDKGMKRIKKEIAKMNGSHVNVGVLSKAGQYSKGKSANLADVATWNEFGVPSKNIPARPFMAQTFETNKAAVQAFVESEKDKILNGSSTTKDSLNRIGVFYVGKTKEIFTKGEFAENALSTKLKKNKGAVGKAKKSAKTLFKSIRASQKRFEESKRGRKKYDFYSDNIKESLSAKQADKISKFSKNLDVAQTGGTTTPLIDTGRLRNSINHEVKIK